MKIHEYDSVVLLYTDESNGAKAHSFGEINLPSSQATLSYRVAVATDAKPRVEISLLNLYRGAKEGNCKLTDAHSRRRDKKQLIYFVLRSACCIFATSFTPTGFVGGR